MSTQFPIEHKDVSLGDIHGLVNWKLTAVSELSALTVDSKDLYKVATVDDGISAPSLHVLVGIAPKSWIQISGGSGGSSGGNVTVNYLGTILTQTISDWVKQLLGADDLFIITPTVSSAKALTHIASDAIVCILDDSTGGFSFYNISATLLPDAAPNSIQTLSGQYLKAVPLTGRLSALIPSSLSQLINDTGYLSSEADPVFSASVAAAITTSDVASWGEVSNKTDKAFSVVPLISSSKTFTAADVDEKYLIKNDFSATLPDSAALSDGWQITLYADDVSRKVNFILSGTETIDGDGANVVGSCRVIFYRDASNNPFFRIVQLGRHHYVPDMLEQDNTKPAFIDNVGQHNVTNVTGTAHTLSADDAGNEVLLDDATAVTVTLTDATTAVDFPIGGYCYVFNVDAGAVNLSASGTANIIGSTSINAKTFGRIFRKNLTDYLVS